MFDLLKRLVCLGTLIALVGSVSCACARKPQELHFEVLDQGDGLCCGWSPGEEPALLVIASREEVDAPAFSLQFQPSLADELRALGYDRNFVVVVFRGGQSVSAPELIPETREVVRDGNEVKLKTHFGQVNSAKGVRPAGSSPYQVLAVFKEGRWGRRIRFILELDGKEVVERERFIP